LTAFIVIAGLGTGNFIFQVGYRRDWGEAARLTFFQAVAIVVYAFVLAIN